MRVNVRHDRLSESRNGKCGMVNEGMSGMVRQ